MRKQHHSIASMATGSLISEIGYGVCKSR